VSPNAAGLSDSNEGKVTMNHDRRDKHSECLLVKEALVETLISQSNTDVLEDAALDGVRPDEAQRRVLDAFKKARQGLATSLSGSTQERRAERVAGRPRALSIDASRARAILRRVAAATSAEGVPLPQAAQLDQVKGDAEALEMVATLKDLGVIGDKDLE
jgi:hypothetical protein